MSLLFACPFHTSFSLAHSRLSLLARSLNSISPVIQEHGISYIRGKFQDRLNAGVVTLQRTGAFFKRILDLDQSSPTVDVRELVAGNDRTIIKFLRLSMVKIAFDHKIIQYISQDTLPETLHYDTNRYFSMRQEFDRLVGGATLLLMASTHLPQRCDRSEMGRAIVVLRSLCDLIAVPPDQSMDLKQIIGAFSHELATANLLAESPSAKANLIKILTNAVSARDDAVRNLISYRITNACVKFMHDRNPIVNDPGFAKQLHPLAPFIEALSLRLYRTIDKNLAVFYPFYHLVVPEAAKDLPAWGN